MLFCNTWFCTQWNIQYLNALECAYSYFGFPKETADSTSNIANAGKTIIKNNPSKMHQLGPKRQTGCPKKDIICNYIYVIMGRKKIM